MNLDALVHTDEAAELAHVPASRIRQWAHRYPRLLPCRHRDGKDRPLYRAGDVLELESRTRARRASTALDQGQMRV